MSATIERSSFRATFEQSVRRQVNDFMASRSFEWLSMASIIDRGVNEMAIVSPDVLYLIVPWRDWQRRADEARQMADSKGRKPGLAVFGAIDVNHIAPTNRAIINAGLDCVWLCPAARKTIANHVRQQQQIREAGERANAQRLAKEEFEAKAAQRRAEIELARNPPKPTIEQAMALIDDLRRDRDTLAARVESLESQAASKRRRKPDSDESPALQIDPTSQAETITP